jgi:hypothetical protein
MTDCILVYLQTFLLFLARKSGLMCALHNCVLVIIVTRLRAEQIDRLLAWDVVDLTSEWMHTANFRR